MFSLPVRGRFYSIVFVLATLVSQRKLCYGSTGMDIRFETRRPFSCGRLILLLGYYGCCVGEATANNTPKSTLSSAWLTLDGEALEVIVLKMGGSSLTDKANRETIHEEALEWFSRAIANSIDSSFLSPPEEDMTSNDGAEEEDNAEASLEKIGMKQPMLGKRKRAFIVIHGAGSFGHHTAREYSLKGRFEPPPAFMDDNDDKDGDIYETFKRRRTMQGLAKTRLSVQTLNRILVKRLIRHGVNAVGISPCIAIPQLQAHGGGDSPDATRQAHAGLERIVRDALQAGIVPVLHGDAGLYGRRDAGILSGDIIMERLGQASWVSHAVFLTDVDGVFSSDPRNDPTASLLRNIVVDKRTLDILEPVLDVSGSSHDHDVTGGLKTKLASAAAVAAAGVNVTIAKWGSKSAEQAMLRNEDKVMAATTVFCR